jgi:hypothetical protein
MTVKAEVEFIDYSRFKSYSQLQRVVAYVFLFVESVRRSLISGGLCLKSDPAERPGEKVDGLPSAGEPGGRTIETSSGGLPRDRPTIRLTAAIIRQAEVFLVAQAQQQVMINMGAGRYATLLPRILKTNDSRGLDAELVVVSGRLGERQSCPCWS